MAASTQGIRAGRAFVELFADDSRLVRGLRAAEKKLKTFGDSIRNFGLKMMGLGAAVLTPLVAAGRVFAGMGSEIADLSVRTGVGVEALSELGYAAEQSGTSLRALGQTLFRMNRRIANAATGSGPAVRALTAGGTTAAAMWHQPSRRSWIEQIALPHGHIPLIAQSPGHWPWVSGCA